jgi:hypothetical protein
MIGRALALALVVAACGPGTAHPRDASQISFKTSDSPKPHEAKRDPALVIGGSVALGAFVTGFALFVLLVIPARSG